MTFSARREQMLKELASDLANMVEAGDMIARNPKNHADKWLVAAAYFADNFELCPLSPHQVP